MLTATVMPTMARPPMTPPTMAGVLCVGGRIDVGAEFWVSVEEGPDVVELLVVMEGGVATALTYIGVLGVCPLYVRYKE